MQTLNIGLNRNVGGTVRAADVLMWIMSSARKVSAATIAQSDTEPTLVARIDAPLSDAEAYALCAAFDQDCIAQSADGISGALLGPKSAEWGAFNPALFIRLSA
jgi:hypothetical protein